MIAAPYVVQQSEKRSSLPEPVQADLLYST